MVGRSEWTNPIWEQIRERERRSRRRRVRLVERFVRPVAGRTDGSRSTALWASGRMFEVLGVSTMLGRTLTAATTREAADRTARWR